MTPLSALLGALGMVFFAFGLLSLMLGLFGAPTLGSWIGINFLAGIALLVVALVVNLEHLRERMRSGEGRRIGRYGSSAVAQTAILLVIVGLLADDDYGPLGIIRGVIVGRRYRWGQTSLGHGSG